MVSISNFAPSLAFLLSAQSAVNAFVTPSTFSRPSNTARNMIIDPSQMVSDFIQSSSSILADIDVDAVIAASPDSIPAVAEVAEAAVEVVEAATTTAAASVSTTVTTDAVVAAAATADAAAATSFSPSYSNASYYTTLGLYVMSFPGIWSQIKRSTTAKLKRKTYISDGENADGGKDLRQQAGEIMAYMKANNYEVVEAGEVITFRGLVQKSTSQAFFLVFCTLLGMASLALVLQIQFQDLVLPVIGKPNWFYLMALSPYAGIYYWQAGDRVDDMKVKLASNDEETENEITIEGNDEELERMWRTLELREKGMVKVEGLLETAA